MKRGFATKIVHMGIQTSKGSDTDSIAGVVCAGLGLPKTEVCLS